MLAKVAVIQRRVCCCCCVPDSSRVFIVLRFSSHHLCVYIAGAYIHDVRLPRGKQYTPRLGILADHPESKVCCHFFDEMINGGFEACFFGWDFGGIWD